MAENRHIQLREEIVDIHGDPLRYLVLDRLTGRPKPDPETEACDKCKRGLKSLYFTPGTLDVLKRLIDILPREAFLAGDSNLQARWAKEIADLCNGTGDDGRLIIKAKAREAGELVIAVGDWDWLFGDEGVLKRKMPKQSESLGDTTDYLQERWTVGMTLWVRDEHVIREQLAPIDKGTATALPAPQVPEE